MTFSHLLIRAAFVLLCCPPLAADLSAAEFYAATSIFFGREKNTWQTMPLEKRLDILTKDGITVWIEGSITAGDYAALTNIHALVPIHSIKLSSPGGAVTDALKIAEFTTTYLIEVSTDISCDDISPSQNYCGCASSCALIWLAAPVRAGGVVKIHRPYFDGSQFPNLSDTAALQRYNEAASQVRLMLQAKGYSQDFIASLFRIPRERAKQLTYQQIAILPIDVALDELISARCYQGNEETLSKYAALGNEINRLTDAAQKLGAELPQLPGYQLEHDPLHAKDFARFLNMWRTIDQLKKQASTLQSVHDQFTACKTTERRQASLRKSGERLAPGTRERIRDLASALDSPEGRYARQLIAKSLPDHDFGRKAAKETEERNERVKTLWQELQRTLPAAQRDFIAAAGK